MQNVKKIGVNRKPSHPFLMLLCLLLLSPNLCWWWNWL